MKLVKKFNCEQCTGEGTITIRNSQDTFHLRDIVYCPLCSGDIYEETDDEDQE